MRLRPLAFAALSLWVLAARRAHAAVTLTDSLEALAEGKLIGRAPFAGGAMGGPFGAGVTLEVDVGPAFPLALSGHSGLTSLGAGAAVGYQFSNGFEAFARLDLLGVSGTLIDYSDLRVFTAGARYSIPFLVPTPFFELMLGPALVVRQTLLGGVDALGVAGAAGVGVALPLGRSFSIGLGVRYWLADGPNGALQTVTVQLTLTANFGMLFRK